MVKGNKLGLVGRCFLAALALGNINCATRPNYLPIRNDLTAREPIRFFTCNHFEDKNKNFKTNYPEEFSGIKNEFKKDEKIELVLHLPVPGINGRRLGLLISNSKKETVFADSYVITEDYHSSIYGANFNLSETLQKREGIGKYNCVAFLDNDLVGLHKFEITE